MMTFEQFTNQRPDESSLSRLWSKTVNHECAMISAFRGTLKKAENRQRSAKLAAALRKKGFSVTQVQGAYVERIDGKDVEVRELSFFVCNQGDDKDFVETMFKMGAMFDQDSVAIIPKGGKGAYLLGTNRTGFTGYRAKQAIGNSTWGGVSGQYFSRIGGRAFEFKTAKPSTLSEQIFAGDAKGMYAESLMANEVLDALDGIEGLDIAES